ncbi:MAG: inorganic phosphate transporter [Verrucomicrobiales bacterium]|nr:inorganic phosphate transporter [Verrucomicrobiales bacterium]
MAWNIGANDVANAMGTSVGSGGLTLKRAILVAAIMEFAGAVLVGSHVTDTVRSGMFDPTRFEAMPLALGFLAALLSAAVWLQLATWRGWPVSTTHSIVGAVVGVGILVGGFDSINWAGVLGIVASWGTSPLLGGGIAYGLFRLIQRHIIESKHPLESTYRALPGIGFYVAFVLCLVMLYKGLKNLGLNLTFGRAALLSTGIGLVAAVVARAYAGRLRRRFEAERVARGVELSGDVDGGVPFVRKEHRDTLEPRAELRPALAAGSELPVKRWEHRREFEFEKVEAIFGAMMIVSACFLAFAHGANDVANAIGPLAAVVELVRSGEVATKAPVALWALALGAIGIVLGLATWGYRVIETIGRKITSLTPSRGFAANLAAATTVVLASRLGLPVSTTHILVGAVLGIGLARGIEYLNLRVVRDIAISWVITVPAGALGAVLCFHLLKLLFPVR